MFPVLETGRLILRELTEKDAEAIFTCFSNHGVTRYYGLDPFESIDQAKTMIHQFAENYQEKRGIRWGIERKDTKELIGTIGFYALAPSINVQKSVMKSARRIGETAMRQKPF